MLINFFNSVANSSIFDAMNFQHFLEMLEIMLQHLRKVLVYCIENATNQKSTFYLRWAGPLFLCKGLIYDVQLPT